MNPHHLFPSPAPHIPLLFSFSSFVSSVDTSRISTHPIFSNLCVDPSPGRKKMSSICADHHHHQHNNLHPHQYPSSSSPTKKPFKDLEIPPKKLLNLTKNKTHQDIGLDMSPYEANLRKYLPYNDCNKECSFHGDGQEADDDLDDPYSSDQFRMYEFKVRRCTRSRSHDWTDCPFAHPGEKARRRDPRKFHYSGTVCPEFRRGGCSRGDNCEFAHGVFECWLHPSRYRTEACKDGKNCKRKVCFFAHSPRQLRILPEVSCGSTGNINYEKSLISPCSSLNQQGHCCCLVCHSVSSSPTSTLLGMSHMSPPLSPSLSSSPPLSPVKHRSVSGFSPVSRYVTDRLSKLQSRYMSYKDVLTELMSSLEATNFSEAAAVSSPMYAGNNSNRNLNIPWINRVSFHDGDQLDQQQQQQFILSPSTPNYHTNSSGCEIFLRGDHHNDQFVAERMNNNNSENGGGLGGGAPDLGWVNELLM